MMAAYGIFPAANFVIRELVFMARKTQAFGQKHIALAACALLVLAGCKDPANIGNIQGSNQVRIVGSSTVFPFAKAASERFSHKNLGKANDPVFGIHRNGRRH